MIAIPNLRKINDGKRIYYNPTKEEKKNLERIKKEVRKKYDINPKSRDLIIKQLISCLTNGDHITYNVSNVEISIIRTDIKNFFPSINKHKLYQKISNSSMLSSQTIDCLKPLFFSKKVIGIPLGLPFSGYLAELYLEGFDTDIQFVFQPVFYFRYVDDIIIIRYTPLNFKETPLVKQGEYHKLKCIFDKYDLQINTEKTDFLYYVPKNRDKKFEFTYLGYKFCIIEKKLDISISEEKLDKILYKIKHLFYLYKKSNRSDVEYWKLYYRLKNSIYGVTSLDKEQKIMRFGLGYSYKYINSVEQMNLIISMIKEQIYSCRLTSKKANTLLNLINYRNNCLEILKKRYDYNMMTTNQREFMKQRIGLTSPSDNLSKIFYVLYRDL